MNNQEIKEKIVKILKKHESEITLHGSVVDCVMPIRYDIIAMEISWLYQFDVPGQVTEDRVNEYFKNK